MKHLNFLSKSSSQSCGHSSVTLASTVGSPSAHRRSTMLRLLSVLVLILTIGVGNVLGAELTYTHAFSTKPSTGDNTLSTITWTVSNTTKLNNYNDGYAGVQVGTSSNKGSITFTSKNNWGAQSSTSYTGYTKVKYVYVWLNNGSGTISANVTIGGKTATKSGTVGKNTSANKDYTKTSKITYTPASDGTTGQIVIAISTSSKAGYVAAIQVVCEQPASCDKKVTITKGTPETGGSFNLDKIGAQDCCSALTATISNITAPSGKRFKAITQSGINSGVTIDQNAKTVTYAANSNGSSTINVTFEDIPTHTIHFNTGGLVDIADATGIQEGAVYNITQTPAASLTANCEYGTFVGWTTTSNIADASVKPTIITSYQMGNSDVTFHAVYSKTVGGSFSDVTINFGYTNWGKTSSFSGNDYTSISQEVDGVSVTDVKNTGSLYANASTTRFYKANELTFAADDNITSIIFDVYNETYKTDISSDVGTCTATSSEFSWEGSAKSVTFIRPSNADSYIQFSSATVTVGSGTTTYSLDANCCDPLAQINGSVDWTNPTTAVVTWDKLDDQVSAWALSWSPNTDGSSITSAITDKGETQKTATVSGLACGTDYTFTLTPTIKSGVCTVETNPTIVSSYPKPTITLDKVGTTNGDFSISGDLTSQCPGENVTVLLSPNSGYEVDALTIGETDYASSVSNNSYTFEMPSTNVTIHATFKTSVKPEVNVTATEGLTGTTLSYGNVAKETDKALTITVTGSNLTNDVTWALADTDDESAGMFSISPSSTTIGKSDATSGQALEITFTPAAAKTYTATLTFSTTGAAADKVITLTGTGKNLYTVTFKCDGQVFDTKQAFDGETVTFPENPDKFDDNYPNFIGWADDAITGIATSAPTLKSASEVINANVEYHAVFGTTPVATGNYAKITTLDDLESGVNYVIAVNNSGDYALQAEKYSDQYYYYMKAASVTVTNDEISNPASDIIWDVTKNSNGKVYIKNGNNYLYITYTGNYTNLKLATSIDNENEEWYTPSFTNGVLTLTSQQYTNYQLAYATGSNFKEYKAGTSTIGSLYIYKQQYSQEFVTRQIVKHTISYNKNTEDEVTGSLPANAIVVDGEDYTVSDATLSRAGYNFIGWNTSNTATTAQTTIVNVTANATLYAVWEQIPTYNIEFSVNEAKVEALKLADQLEGASIVFPDAAAITAASAFPTTDKKFVGWIEASSYASDDAPTFVTSATAAADKTYYAVFADVEEDAVECTYNTASTCYISNWSNIERGAKASSEEVWQMYGYSSNQNPEGKICTNASYANLLSLKLNARTGNNSTTLTISYRADENAEWTQLTTKEISKNQTYSNYSISLTGIPSGAQYLRIKNSTSSFYIRSITLTSGSVSDYVTNIAPLDHIAITAAPTKTVYKKGEELDLTGMVVKATYGTGVGAREKTLASDKYTVDLAETALETTNTEFEVSYTENAVAKTATQAIKVFALDKIEITAAPATTIYLEGATFDKTGMVVEATWGTGEDKIVETLDAEDYTVDPSVLDATSITSVTISYTHEDVTQTTNQAVTVNVRPSLTMSWKVGNADPTETKIYEEGGKYLLALPAEDPDPVDAGFTSDFVFKGWTSDETIAKSGTGITYAADDDEITEATTFHAVFALKNGEDAPAGYRLVNAAPEAGETVIFARKVNNTYYAFNNSAGSSELTITDGVVTSTTDDVLWDAKEQCNTTTATGLFYFVSEQTTNLIHINSNEFNITNSAQNGDIVFSANGDGSFTAARRNNSGTLDRWISAYGTNAFGVTSTESSAVALYVFKYSAATVATYSNYRFAPSSVVAPEITLAEGTYYGVQSTTITQSQSKPIYYTLDGTNPTNASTLYEGAISLNEAGTKTIKAVAYDEATDDYSAFDEATYTIVTSIATPTLPASENFYTENKEVEISHELTSEGAEILYSYDGVNYSTYSSALNITETKTVYAKATIGSLTSEVVSATYTKGVVVNYSKLTSTNQLAAGMEFILVSVGSGQYVTAGALNTSYLDTLRISAPVENLVTITRDVKEFTLSGEPSAWEMTSEDGTLYSDAAKKVNYSDNGDGTWNLTFSNNTLTIANNGTGNGNLRYNASSPRFTTYNSEQTTVDIYYKEYATAYTLTYDVDGTENDKTVKVVEGYEYTIVNNVFGDAPEGGIDAYWKDANNNLYTVGDKIILTSNMTLTPVWSQVVRSSLAEGKMGTICPKQEVKYPTGASFYELTYKTIENGVPYKVFFDEIAEGASLVAGKPYLFVADGESITGVKVGDEATEGVNDYNGFHGILNSAHTTLSVTADDAANYKYYIITNNEIRLCGAGTFTIPVERAYIDMSALSAEQVAQSPGRRRVCLTNRAAETVTGVEELNASEAPVKVMIDGLLFIIRGEKMYNANGQVVK